MQIIDHIKHSKGKTLFSFEILPPLKGKSIDAIYKAIDPLIEFNPSFIDVTYHREDYILKKRKDGSFDRIATRKRPGTVAICAAVMNKYKIDAVPHIICGGFTKEDTENALIDLNFLGIDNVLALRGDNKKGERNFEAEEGGHENSLELIHQIENMNHGIYLDEELTNGVDTSFCTGAACYPEKHVDAPNMKTDLKFLKRKVDAGAKFLVTQMFFDNAAYFDFVKKCRDMNIHIPIIPGIKPITRRSQVMQLPKIFNINLPEELTEALEGAKDDKTATQIGEEWCVNQCKELIDQGAPVLHFYTMGKGEVIQRIASKLF